MDDFDLGDLNIVAIPVAQSSKKNQFQAGVTGKRNKRKNKYERRRQAAAAAATAKAKKVKTMSTTNDNTTNKDKNQNKNQNKTDKGTNMTTAAENVTMTNSDQGKKETRPTETKMSKDSSEKINENESKPTSVKHEDDGDEKKNNSKSNTKEVKAVQGQKVDSQQQNVLANNGRVENNERKESKESASGSGSMSMSISTEMVSKQTRKDNDTDGGKYSKKQNQKNNMNSEINDGNDIDEEEERERAKYMAEFHARPMELDRRAGISLSSIRNSNNSNGNQRHQKEVISKESTHIFGDIVDDDDDDYDDDDDEETEMVSLKEENSAADDKINNDKNRKKNKNKKKASNINYNDWNSLNLPPRFIQTMTNQFQLTRPTTIQVQSLLTFFGPNEMDNVQRPKTNNNNNNNNNILIHSETGSGKTLAYLLPILQSLGYKDGASSSSTTTNESAPTTTTTTTTTSYELNRVSRKQFGTQCIILCPTRELASQTLHVVEKFCQSNFAGWMIPGGLLGGDSRNSEKSRLRKGLGIIIATPGRLLDHLHKTESLLMNLKGKLKWLVLDEADRLLDMGLGDQIRQIVQVIRANEASKVKTSQPWWRSVLVSATVTKSVQNLAQERMLCGNQPWVWVRAGGGGGASSSSSNINKTKNASTNGNHDNTTPFKSDNISATATASNEERNKSNATNTSNDIGKKNDNDDDEGYSKSTPRQLAQFHITVTAKLRLTTLLSFLIQRVVTNGERIVVFLATCASVDYHYQLLNSMDCLWNDDDDDDKDKDNTGNNQGIFGSKAQIYKLHGSVPHAKRNQTLKQFDAGVPATSKSSTKEQRQEQQQRGRRRAAILLTTDVSARGLNLSDIDWTVQYDPPCEISDYVHRVGRVARAGKAGHSLLFLLPSERTYLDVLSTKGISNITPLSLASTLNQAAELCPDITNIGQKNAGYGGSGIVVKNELSSTVKKGGGKHRNNSRMGEYFSAELQRLLEDCVVQDDIKTKQQAAEEKKKEQAKGSKRKKRDRNNNNNNADNNNNDGSTGLVRKEGLLMELARAAFLSFLRAYSTKREASVRTIFSARALHLGHIARSFALKEPPTSLATKHRRNVSQQQRELQDEKSNLPKSLDFSKKILDEEDNNNGTRHDNKNGKDYDEYDEYDDHDMNVGMGRPTKRSKKNNEKGKSAKTILLENAMKMQSNLMDAM